MKTIGLAVVSFVAGLLGSVNAGELPRLMDVAGFFQSEPFTLAPHPSQLSLNSWWPYSDSLLESGGPAVLQLDRWSPPERAAAQYSNRSGRERAHAKHYYAEAIAGHITVSDGTLSRAEDYPASIVRSIEVQYSGASERSKKEILAKMRTRVGGRYSGRVIEDDIRQLTQLEDVKRVRVFGEPFNDGVSIVLIVQSKSGFDFNIGYQF